MKIKNPRIKLRDKSIENSRGTIFMSVEVSAEKFDETTANVYEGQNLPGKRPGLQVPTLQLTIRKLW